MQKPNPSLQSLLVLFSFLLLSCNSTTYKFAIERTQTIAIPHDWQSDAAIQAAITDLSDVLRQKYSAQITIIKNGEAEPLSPNGIHMIESVKKTFEEK